MIKLEEAIWKKNGKWVNKEKPKWEIEGRYIWSMFMGDIPEKHVIFHLDGDSTNNDIHNLECISRKELLQRNSVKGGRTLI